MTAVMDRSVGASREVAGLTAEDRLILAAARSHLRAIDRQTIGELIVGSLDWSYVLDVGVRHGVGPLLCHGLSGFGVPEEVRGRLDELYESSRSRNDSLFAALGEVVHDLNAAGVDVIGLKDAHLAVEVYPDRALRPMGDIDILIRRGDYDAAATALRLLGFAPLPHDDVPYTRRYAMGQHFRRAADELWLDVQWNVAQRAWDTSSDPAHTYSIDRMWETASPLVIDGYELLAPSPEHMLLHLFLHLEGHEYSELILFCDIVELLRHYDGRLDWDEFVRLTRTQHAESSVYHALVMVERLFGVTLPAGLFGQLQNPYFAGTLFRPIFGNLTSLHVALDEIRLAASPLQETLDELEVVVRRQAARAKVLYDLVDRIASRFVCNGGCVIAFVGQPSQRLFPDAALPAFGELCALVRHEDVEILRDTLASSGFDHRSQPATLRVPVESADPILNDDRSSLTLVVEFTSSIDSLRLDARGSSNKEAALCSVKTRLSRRPRDEHALARLSVVGLSDETLLQTLADAALSRPESRLFGLCSMLDVMQRLPSGLETRPRSGAIPQDRGVEEIIATLVPLLSRRERERLGAEQLAEVSPLRLLEWARYGPASFDRHPLFRPVYFIALCFLVVPGARAKARYLARVLRGQGGLRQVAPGLMSELVAALRRRRLRSTQPLSYWTEAEPIQGGRGRGPEDIAA